VRLCCRVNSRDVNIYLVSSVFTSWHKQYYTNYNKLQSSEDKNVRKICGRAQGDCFGKLALDTELLALTIPVQKPNVQHPWEATDCIQIFWRGIFVGIIYSHAPHNDVSVNDGPHIQRWSHNITIYYNTYHCGTITYSIQYSNMLYRFVA